MSEERLQATPRESEAGGAGQRGGRPGEFEQERRGPAAAAAATRRAVGVYDRPARRPRLSLPLVVILILSALVSAAAAARFLF